MDSEHEEVVTALYDVVSSPEIYDDFMIDLHRKLKTMRDQNQGQQATFLASHLQRAASLVDIVTPWRRDVEDELHSEISRRMQAALVVNDGGNILDANTSAKLVYDLVPGKALVDLPIDTSDLQALTGNCPQERRFSNYSSQSA